MAADFWRPALLHDRASVQEAVRCLNDAGLQIVLVVDGDGRLVGTITDGDVRRGLLRGITLPQPVDAIVQREPLVAPQGLSHTLAQSLMRSNGIHHLPVIDDDRRVVGLHLWHAIDDGPGPRPNLMVVMAGGRGVRLRPHTENCPKPMLPVGDKPMLEHILERARSDGIRRFLFATHYLGHMVEEHFGDGARWDVAIDYLREDRPLGTGGALGLIGEPPEEAFLVTNGDVLADVRYGEILDYHERQHAAGTMAVRSHEWQHPFGVVRTEGVHIVGFEEKPLIRTQVNAGIYVLEPRVLTHLRRDEHCNMPGLFERLQAAAERTIVYPIHESWLDVGRPTDLAKAREAHSA